MRRGKWRRRWQSRRGGEGDEEEADEEGQGEGKRVEGKEEEAEEEGRSSRGGGGVAPTRTECYLTPARILPRHRPPPASR